MPIPTPKQGEKPEEFIGRCMSDDVMIKEYTEPAQRYAVCVGQLKSLNTSEGEE
jgi:hypothetical protein